MSGAITYIMVAVIIVLFGLSIFVTLKLTQKPLRPEKVEDTSKPKAEPVIEKTRIISPGTGELLEGAVTLTIDPNAKSRLISYLTLSLSENPNIQMLATGENPGKGYWIKLFVKKPLPLYRILYFIPVVQEVALKGEDIYVVTI
jgi:hypothetical protein